jgi:Alpha amylase, catalytic domain
MVDGGYDVTDYRAIDPLFGTLAEAETLIWEAHRQGLRVLADLVPNHTSDQHPWFRAALAGGSGSPPAGGSSSVPAAAVTAGCRPMTGAACSVAPPGPTRSRAAGCVGVRLLLVVGDWSRAPYGDAVGCGLRGSRE